MATKAKLKLNARSSGTCAARNAIHATTLLQWCGTIHAIVTWNYNAIVADTIHTWHYTHVAL